MLNTAFTFVSSSYLLVEKEHRLQHPDSKPTYFTFSLCIFGNLTITQRFQFHRLCTWNGRYLGRMYLRLHFKRVLRVTSLGTITYFRVLESKILTQWQRRKWLAETKALVRAWQPNRKRSEDRALHNLSDLWRAAAVSHSAIMPAGDKKMFGDAGEFAKQMKMLVNNKDLQ